MSIYTVTAVATDDGQPVHPAVKPVLDALTALRSYQPSSPEDAALLIRSLGGDGIGEHHWGVSVVNEAFDVMLAITDRVLEAFPEAWDAAVYADDALNCGWDTARQLLSAVREGWLDDPAGELSVCQAAAVLERPHVAIAGHLGTHTLTNSAEEEEGSTSCPTPEYGAPWLPITSPTTPDTTTDEEPVMGSAYEDNECILCGAPGGYPYCNDACRIADQCDCEGDTCTCTCT